MADSVQTILDRMLSSISNEYDKSEGSFFYDIEKPIATELEALGEEADLILDRGFADTATGIYLDRKAYDQGLVRKAATKSSTTVTITGSVGAKINVGDKVASETVTFVATETKTIATGQTTMVVNVECETEGTIGNVPVGAIKYFPITISGLSSVTNPLEVTNGFDAETDNELRSRYYSKIRTPSTSGNKFHYLNWAKEVTGVGDAKVFPLWNGNGTVKVVIVNSNKRAANAELITSVANYIEENRPIGATITVVSATEKTINVNATLTLKTGYTLSSVKATIESNLTSFLKEIAFVDSYVSYAKVGNVILNSDGVKDYSGLTINSGTANIATAETEIAVLGVVTLG